MSPDSFLPVRVRRGLQHGRRCTKVEEWKLELPGVIVEVEPQRAYPNSRFAAHLLGYVREANDEQLKQGRYRRGDMVGQSGLERLLDEFLRGRDGGERIEVDAMGRHVRLIQSTEPHPGAQVVTTIDRRIQEAAERAMEGHAGAVVVMDPRNGDVLAMVSTPAFEIDRFTGTIDRDAWLRVMQDPEHPAAQPHHPEPVRARLGVQDRGGGGRPAGRHASRRSTACTAPASSTWATGRSRTGRRKATAPSTCIDAMRQSCNVYFYQAGLKIGGAVHRQVRERLRLRRAPPASTSAGEKLGLIPQPKVRRDRPRRRPTWHAGETVNMSIGQGAVLVTPMQVARFMSAVANGGVLWKPRLVQRIERPEQGRGVERRRQRHRPRRALPDGVGVPAAEPVGRRQRRRHRRRAPASRASTSRARRAPPR